MRIKFQVYYSQILSGKEQHLLCSKCQDPPKSEAYNDQGHALPDVVGHSSHSTCPDVRRIVWHSTLPKQNLKLSDVLPEA